MNIAFVGDNEDEFLAVQLALHALKCKLRRLNSREPDCPDADACVCLIVGQVNDGNKTAIGVIVDRAEPFAVIAATHQAPGEIQEPADYVINDIAHGVQVLMEKLRRKDFSKLAG